MKLSIRRLSLAAVLGWVLSAGLGWADAAQTEPVRWTINMRDADIRDFVEHVASISGQTLIVDPRVKGQVTVISQEPLNLEEVYQLFLSVMSTHGFSVVTQGGQARVVPDAEARSLAGAPVSGSGPDALETRLLQVQQTPVSELLAMVRPLVSANGHLAAVPSSNALIVSDRRANIERLVSLIAQVDGSSKGEGAFYELRHAWANDVAALLRDSIKGAQGSEGFVQIVADPRTNRVLVVGPPQARNRLLQLAQRFDVPPVRSANTRVIRLRHADAKDLAQTLGELSEQLRSQTSVSGASAPVLIRADTGLNALILMAEPDTIAQLEDIVGQLDVPRAQVLVEAAIVEMTGDISEALGVQWAIDGRSGGGLGGVNFGNSGLSVGTLLGAIQGEMPISLPDGAILGAGSDNFGALITALSANSNSNLLSTPSLLTLDNQEAKILVGQNVPFQTGSYTTDSAGASNPFTTIEREDVGVTLKVTPHINEGGTMRLVIKQEISSIAPSASASQTLDVVTNKRLIESTVLADNGQVIVLGGLIQDDVTRSESKVPLLGDIPLLGRAFRSTKDTKIKRNLMVFLRPSVVRDGDGMANLSLQKYRGLQRQDPSTLRFLPVNPQQLFEPANEPALDLRGASPVQPSAPKPVSVPAVAPAAISTSAAAPAAKQRFSILITEGSSEVYMRTLIERHPKEPMRLEQEQRAGQPWFRIMYGNYAQADVADFALRNLPEGLPRHRSKVVAL